MEKLICFQDLIELHKAIKGKEYQIIYEDDEHIVIRNEDGQLHFFSKDKNDESYFGNWFKRK